jgi:hypothetical protein
MFPLDFPLSILQTRARPNDRVLDPFCGRGTTNFAARLLGLGSLGVDSSPVAAAIAASKLTNATSDAVVAEARTILESAVTTSTPQGDFWRWAYHPRVLQKLCCLRSALFASCSTPTRLALRGVLLGALHGPVQKTIPGYFSNQCPRTYAPKPAYALKFWKSRQLKPPEVNLLSIIEHRARRFFSDLPTVSALIRLSDSRDPKALRPSQHNPLFQWVITSPPYYGMRTYIADQWLRHWFLGGPDHVDYCQGQQIAHSSPDAFVSQIRTVWHNAAKVCSLNAALVIRFGGIRDRDVEPLDLIKASLKESGWTLRTIRQAGSAVQGKRQADAFLRNRTVPMSEYDAWAIRHHDT